MNRAIFGSALILLAGCKAIASQSEAGAPAETELATRLPSPTSPSTDFKVDDDVAVVKDDGAFQVDGRVAAVSGKLVYVVANGDSSDRLSATGWIPAEEVRGTPTVQRTAERGYRVRLGNGRLANALWYPSTQVFPTPWAATANIKVGETFYERRFGNFESPKCVVTSLSPNPRVSVTARCNGSDRETNIERKDVLHAFNHPKLSDLSVGEIVYFDKTAWAMVVGKQGTQVVIRESSFASTDRAVDVSRVESVR